MKTSRDDPYHIPEPLPTDADMAGMGKCIKRMLRPDDEEDIACYSMRWENDKPIIEPVSAEQLEALPESVTETINIHATCVYDGLMYGPTEESLTEEPLWSQ